MRKLEIKMSERFYRRLRTEAITRKLTLQGHGILDAFAVRLIETIEKGDELTVLVLKRGDDGS